MFTKIKNTHPDAKLFLVGDGDYETLQGQIMRLGINDSVHYLGVRSDVSRLLQAGDLFIFPSLYEGFPGAVLEAETAGLPCVISDTITDEVVLTEKVKQMSLKDSPEHWAEAAIESFSTERADCVDAVKAAGYDIRDLVHKMEAFYLQCHKENSK